MSGGQTVQGAFGAIPPSLFAVLFPFLFCAIWVLVCRIIAAMGWSALAERHAATGDVPADAQRFRFQSMMVRGALPANYGNCVNGWIDRTGLYLRPILIYRMFHPLLLLRWSDIARVEQKSRFLSKMVEVDILGGLPGLWLYGRLGKAMLAEWQTRNPQTPPQSAR